jgi:peptide/nickel transport system permease protein
MVAIALYVAVAVAAPLLAPGGETTVVGDVWARGIWDWSAGHDPFALVLGTDQLGRDMVARLLYAARNTLAIAVLTTLLSFSLGITAGFAAAILRGAVDAALSRVVDVVMAVPTLIFALMVLSIVGTSIPAMIGVIAVLDATRVFRISRAVAMDIVAMEYIDAARLRGETLWWLMRREILPNALPPLLAEFGLRFCFVFLFIASLSFLGLGVQPPMADLGSMVRENAAGISFGLPAPLFPAACITLLVLAINLVVDWLLHNASRLRAPE